MTHHADYEADHTPEAIRERIAKNKSQDYLKDSIYGAIDGAVTTFAVVSSVKGAGLSSGIVIILGIANLLADGFSMASGNFLGTRAENQSERKARREEEAEIDSNPEGEREEIRQIYAAKGLSGDTLEEVVNVITSDKERWLDIMMQEEHGVTGRNPSALKAGLATFVAFLVIGGIPLAAYIIDFIDPTILGNPFGPSCALTAIAFFSIGALKSRYVEQHWALSGGETLGIGTLAALVAYGVGLLLRPFAEGL